MSDDGVSYQYYDLDMSSGINQSFGCHDYIIMTDPDESGVNFNCRKTAFENGMNLAPVNFINTSSGPLESQPPYDAFCSFELVMVNVDVADNSGGIDSVEFNGKECIYPRDNTYYCVAEGSEVRGALQSNTQLPITVHMVDNQGNSLECDDTVKEYPRDVDFNQDLNSGLISISVSGCSAPVDAEL